MINPDDEVRRPPAPPSAPPVEKPAESAQEPTPGKEQPPDPPGPPPTLGANEWLDPTSERHRRRSHTQLTRRRDRLRRRWRRWRRKRRKIAESAHWYRPRNVVIGLVTAVVVLILTVLISTYVTISGIRRAPLMPVEASAPSLGTNIVLVSSNGQPAALALDSRTLVVQFIHISANYQSGQVIDLPNNLMMGTGGSARTIGKIYAAGGMIGVISALQNDMGLTVNHVIQTSFSGYAKLTDDLGGLTLQTDTGLQHFTGTQAQAYVDQASAPEIGIRFQHWSKAMMKGILQPGVLLNPLTAWSVFSDTASDIVVDDTLDNGALVSLFWDLKSLSPSDLHFFTAPNGGYVSVNHEHVLRSDPVAFGRLSTAIRDDNLATIGLFQ